MSSLSTCLFSHGEVYLSPFVFINLKIWKHTYKKNLNFISVFLKYDSYLRKLFIKRKFKRNEIWDKLNDFIYWGFHEKRNLQLPVCIRDR